MQQRPQRPYVPHRTPKASRQVVTHSEFRLSKPFVPGSSNDQIGATRANDAVEAPANRYENPERLPDIDDFLDTDEPGELPPIEHFVDPLPAVGAFAPDAEGALLDEMVAAMDYTSGGAAVAAGAETGWVEDDWQHYDWRAAAALGEGVEAEASNEWATTDWDAHTPVVRQEKPTAAHAIANALDQIAQRIREGELTVPPPGALSDPTAIAATLAALLGVRR